MAWPSLKAVTAARVGHVAEVVFTREGPIRGYRSSTPHVYAQIWKTGAVVACEHCGAKEPEPEPPGSGAPGAPRTPLMSPGTAAHSTFLLTWLTSFERTHAKCQI